MHEIKQQWQCKSLQHIKTAQQIKIATDNQRVNFLGDSFTLQTFEEHARTCT